MKIIQLLLMCVYMCMSLLCNAQSGYSLYTKIPLKGNGDWDYLQVDQVNNRLFVTHSDRAHVLSLKTNKEIGQINNLKGAHHIALLPKFNKGFISNGANNTVLVFDYTSLDSLTSIKIDGINPDPMCYDSYSGKLYVFCDNDLAIIIDPATNKTTGQIALKGAPEFALPDGKGLIYNNVEDKNAMSTIDVNKKAVIKTYNLKKNAAPTGMAADFKNDRLFIVCRGINELAVLDNKTGKIVVSLPIGKKVDGVYFDERNRLIICPGGDGSLTFIRQKDKNKYEVVQTLSTKAGAKTMAFDSRTQKIYVCSADIAKVTNEMVPGSFKVLVYAKSK